MTTGLYQGFGRATVAAVDNFKVRIGRWLSLLMLMLLVVVVVVVVVLLLLWL